MLPRINQLLTERDHLTTQTQAIADTAAKESRDLSEAERSNIASWQQRCASIDSELEMHNASLESERKYLTLRAAFTDRDAADDAGGGGDGGGDGGGGRHRTSRAVVVKSIGEQFVESDQFRNYGGASTSGRFDIEASVVDGLQVRASTGNGGAGAEPRGPGGVIYSSDLPIQPYRWEAPALPAYRTPMLDVVAKENVTTSAVEWVRFTPNPMTAAPKVAEGAPKPQAELKAEVESGTLDTFAHWVPITRQALEDYPRIRSIIEGKLREGLVRATEEATAAAIVDEPDVPDVDEPWLLAAIRKGVGLLQDAGYGANAVLLNPMDWADFDIDLLMLTVAGATVGRQFWGLSPVPSSAVASGTAYVGAFRDAITFFDRRVTSIYVTDSHANYFIENKLVILGETRALPVVTNPQAVVKATGDPSRPIGGDGGGSNGLASAPAAA